MTPLSAFSRGGYISFARAPSIVATRTPRIDIDPMRVMHFFKIPVLNLIGLAFRGIPAVALGRHLLECAADTLHVVDQLVQKHRSRKLVVRKIEAIAQPYLKSACNS